MPSSVLYGACSPAQPAHVFNQLSSVHEIRFSSVALLLGPVHTYVGIFTNIAFCIWFGLSSTSKQIIKSLKTELLGNFFLYCLHVHRTNLIQCWYLVQDVISSTDRQQLQPYNQWGHLSSSDLCSCVSFLYICWQRHRINSQFLNCELDWLCQANA